MSPKISVDKEEIFVGEEDDEGRAKWKTILESLKKKIVI